MLTSKAIFFMNFLPEKKYGVPSHNFVKKNVLCEKGDEITRFDGSVLSHTRFIIFVAVRPRLVTTNKNT
jgi:hypothetical protein